MKLELAGSATFLRNFGETSAHRKILQWLDLHGGTMTLLDILNDNVDAPDVVICTIADFAREGLVACHPSLDLARLAEIDPVILTTLFDVSNSMSSPPGGFKLDAAIELTDEGRHQLKSP